MKALLLAAATAASACAAAPSTTAGAAASKTAETACPVLVRFGSFASGVDRPALDAVRAALQAQRPAPVVVERRWGREGEIDLCVQGPAALADVARGALPKRKLNGYVDVLVAGRRVFTTQTPS